jgi:2-polyprenyl-3-methyl-5-hydroxy-6-metoxy-1,4-benzoquinol methylase
MNNIVLPQVKDWNQFWSLETTARFTRASWSKRRIMRILRPFVCHGKKALDAGCGSGFFSKYFCDQGMRTYSLDYSNKALEIAQLKTQGRTQTIRCDFLSEQINKKVHQKFDIIFTDGLFEHFSKIQQDKIFNNFVNVLSDTGIMVTFVPNRWSPWQIIRPIFMPKIEEKPFCLKELTDLNHRNGMKILSCGGVNTFPFSFSPDLLFGRYFGMLLFAIAKRPR